MKSPSVPNLYAAASGHGGGGCCPPVVDPYTLLALWAGTALATYFLRVLITVNTLSKNSSDYLLSQGADHCYYGE